MQQESTCSRCGASVLFSAKYCRQCGAPLDSSELTTRTLVEPSGPPNSDPHPIDHPTRPAGLGQTSPTYMPSPMAPQPPAPVYGVPPAPPYAAPRPPTSNKTILVVVLALIVAALLGLGVVAFAVLSRPHRPPPVGTAPLDGMPPPLDPPPVVPAQPGMPPPPPGSPGQANVRFPFDESLRYPGATVTNSMSTEDKKVATLQTSDPIDKVADWYRKKIDPTEDMNTPGNVIMKNDEVQIVLRGVAGGTQILITDETD